jgi:hypothetical protein
LKELKRISGDLNSYFTKEIGRWTLDEHLSPTIDTVAMLPKEELAIIAEALINLTIHKRRTSQGTESVGPPTDVAIITKGDGFIWIKRKHYFDPKLNPHYMSKFTGGLHE